MKESEARQHRRHEDGYPVQQIVSDTFQIRRALSLRTARIHRRQRNVFRRRFLVLPLDDAQSVSEFAETSFIVAWVGDAMMWPIDKCSQPV